MKKEQVIDEIKVIYLQRRDDGRVNKSQEGRVKKRGKPTMILQLFVESEDKKVNWRGENKGEEEGDNEAPVMFAKYGDKKGMIIWKINRWLSTW